MICGPSAAGQKGQKILPELLVLEVPGVLSAATGHLTQACQGMGLQSQMTRNAGGVGLACPAFVASSSRGGHLRLHKSVTPADARATRSEKPHGDAHSELRTVSPVDRTAA